MAVYLTNIIVKDQNLRQCAVDFLSCFRWGCFYQRRLLSRMFKRRASVPSGRSMRVNRMASLPEDPAALASHAIDRELERERAQRSHYGLAAAGMSDAAL